jgi:hypothetical protein
LTTCWSWSDGNVLGLTMNGKVVLGLFQMSGEAQGQLRAAYGAAFGTDAEEVELVLPWETRVAGGG